MKPRILEIWAGPDPKELILVQNLSTFGRRNKTKNAGIADFRQILHRIFYSATFHALVHFYIRAASLPALQQWLKPSLHVGMRRLVVAVAICRTWEAAATETALYTS